MSNNCIREIRKRLGMTQAELAKRLGTSQGAIQMIETGQRGLDIEWMKRIAEVFDVEPWMLLPKEMQPNLTKEEIEMLNLFRVVKEKQIKTDNPTNESKAG